MLVGQKLGPYTIDKELGSGAMGTVYRGKHAETGDRVAIKFMALSLGSNETAYERFKRETKIIKKLEHPNIVRLVLSGRFGKNPFYAMEYVEGESLDRALARRNRFGWEEVVRIAMQLCDALHHAHQIGIIHRDLKPSNLMIQRDGTVKLMDFGIAKDLDQTALTETNRTVGTAAYMSPEQCRGDKSITHKSDLYSLGVMLYELLTGRKPFSADSAMEMFMQHTKGTFERPSRLCLDIPIWLDTLVCQLLEKSPDKRPFDAMMVNQALSKIKEKVDAQQSAGIERAKERRIDRTDLQPALDKTDIDAARTLLHKKKRKVPFYTKGWFLAVGLAGMVVLSGFLFYLIFLKAPSAESMLAEIKRLKESDDLQIRESALKDDFMPRFLRLYADHPQADQVREWRDKILGDQCERQMYNRRRTGREAEPGEKLARLALDDEDLGRLAEAEKNWEDLSSFKDKSEDDPLRPWGLVAVKYLKLHEDAWKLEKNLMARVKEKKNADSEKAIERLIQDAMQLEEQGKTEKNNAIESWEKAKKSVDAESADRTYYLLATKHMRKLKQE